jgi:hypothetical protein
MGKPKKKRSKFMTARKRQLCAKCGSWIEPGQSITKDSVAGFIHTACEGFDIEQQYMDVQYGYDEGY